jgi:hypothetical protein
MKDKYVGEEFLSTPKAKKLIISNVIRERRGEKGGEKRRREGRERERERERETFLYI